MKKVLLASTALIMSAGVAAADVAVSGDGRMGVIDNFGDDTDLTFTSRIRIAFSASGETDGGLAFGGSSRVDDVNADGIVNPDEILTAGGIAGTAGSVFIEGAFGKLSMGDVDGGARSAVGHVSGVGLTGLGDTNEIIYIANAGDTPAALYEYSTGDLAFYASAGKPDETSAGNGDEFAVGVSYGLGNYTVALGYESADTSALGDSSDHIVVGASAGFGDATVKAVYGTGDGTGAEIDQYALSLDYVFGATTATVFYNNRDISGTETDALGVGAAYDLGGGASLKGGYVSVDAGGVDDDAFDFGVSMSF